MLPTLKPGQDVLCFNWAYFFSEPKIGDIAVVRRSGQEIIKRIHKVNDRSIDVTGDNEKESTDSRNFGAIDKSEIVGKVILVVR